MIQFQNELVCVFESALFKTTSTVIIGSEFLLIVDPNWLPDEIVQIREFVDRHKESRKIYLLFTHSDYDHIIAYGAFPDAKVIASRAFFENAEKQSQLDQILQFDHDYYVSRNYPITYPEPDILIESDGQVLQFAENSVQFFLAPGHNRDGIFAVLNPGGIFIAGDYLSDVEFPFIYHSFQEYENTLKKADTIFQTIDIQVLVPGHGSATQSKTEMKKRLSESLEYLSDLKNAVLEGQNFDEEALWKRYAFPKSQRKFHLDNLELVKKEFGKL